MSSYEQRKHPLHLISWRLVTVGMVGVLTFLILATWGAYEKERETREKRAVAEQEFTRIDAQKNALEAEIEHLNTQQGLEAELRSQFDLGKDGEGLIVVVDKEENKPVEKKEGKPSLLDRFFSN